MARNAKNSNSTQNTQGTQSTQTTQMQNGMNKKSATQSKMMQNKTTNGQNKTGSQNKK